MGIVELAVVLLPLATAAAPERHRMIAIPPELELRPGVETTVRISALDPPTLHANVGEIGPPRPVASGIYEATYHAPGESHPQVAIITATTSRGYGWIAVPLAGTGELEVRTRPGGDALVRVGDRWFGPVRADSTGRAVIPIVVPPGTTHATYGERRVELAAPEPVHPFAVVTPASVPASARATVTVRVFVVDMTGVPRGGAPLRMKVSQGTTSVPREIEPGVLEASWDVPAGALGDASMSIWLAEPQGGDPVRLSLPRPGAAGAGATPTPTPTPPPPVPPASAPKPAVATSPPRQPALDRGPPPQLRRDVAIDFRTGAAWDAEGLRALTAGAQVAWFPAALRGLVGVALDGSGLAVREKERRATAQQALDLSTVARVFPVQGLALLRVPVLGGTALVGAGGGSAYGNVRVATRGRPTEDFSGWAAAFAGLVGFAHPLGAGSLFAEVRGQHVGTIAEQDLPGTLELVGVSLGYRIEL